MGAILIAGFLFIIISSVALLPTLEAIDDCYKVEGILVPAITPVDENGALNTDAIGGYARYLKDVGADGVIVGDTTGEGPTLNVSDNKRLLDAWLEVRESLGLLVILSVGGVPLPDTLEMSEYGDKMAVDAMFVLPEVYYKPQNFKVLAYYMEMIYQVAPNTALVFDDNPEYTGVEVDIVSFFELATETISTFRGVRSTSFERLLLLRNILRDQQQLYAANYFYLAPQVCLGFKNYALAEFNFFPRLILDIIRNRERGYASRSTKLYQRLLDLIDVITARGNKIAAEKEAMRIITGIEVGSTRPPIPPLCAEEREALRQNLQDENIKLAPRDYDE